MLRRSPGILLAVAVWSFLSQTASAQLVFNITNDATATQPMIDGFPKAAGIWSAAIHDPITINVTIKGSSLPAGVTGFTTSFTDTYSYAVARAALVAKRTSGIDISSTNALQAGPAFSMLINRTANNPNGIVSATPYFDTGLGGPGQAGAENNSSIRINTANQKVLGLLPANLGTQDGTITFSNTVNFDYDRSNGIAANQIDFVGIATHELGHLLGFQSGVDTLGNNGTAPGLNDNKLPFVTTLDLFRFSSRSVGTGGGVGVIDWTADNTTKYLSVNGGATALAAFSNGVKFGDGVEASHWKDNSNLGIMDPTAGVGELLAISNNDLSAFDIIGYDVAPVPEPASYLAICAAFTCLAYVVQTFRLRMGPT